MATIKFEKHSEEWFMFAEYWKMCQDFWNVEDNDKYWQQLTEAIDNFYDKFKHIHLARELAVSFGNAQDKKFEEQRK